MTLTITQDNTRIELLGSNGAQIIHKLYELASNPNNTVILYGNINSPAAYEDDVTYLNTNCSPNLVVSSVKQYINFNDSLAESLLLNANIGDGTGVTKLDASQITLNQFEGDLFYGTAITNADWFQYFTGIGTYINQLRHGFLNCTLLTSIIFPDLILSLGHQHNTTGMFSSCTSLQSVVFPRDLTEIRENFFKNCTNLTNVDFSKCTQSVTFWDQCFSDTNISNINFPSNLVSIKSGAFNSAKFSSIEIPASVTFLAGTAFNGCTSLASITFEEGNSNLEIGGNSVYNETGLGLYIPSHTLTLPARTTSIGARAIAKNVTTLYVLATTPPTLAGSLQYNGLLTKIYVPASSVSDYQSSWSSYSSIIEAILT